MTRYNASGQSRRFSDSLFSLDKNCDLPILRYGTNAMTWPKFATKNLLKNRSETVGTIFLILTFFLSINFNMNCFAQTEYRLPPPAVVEIIDADPVPRVSFSPDREWMLFIERSAMPSIEDLARPMLQLAGLRIDPVGNSRFATDFDRGLVLRRRSFGEGVRVQLPVDSKIASTRWSHRSDFLVVTTIDDDGQGLWLVDVNRPDRPRRLTNRLSTVLGGFDWMPDGRSLIVNLVPDDRVEPPLPPNRPIGPNIQESYGNLSPVRTYQDLLQNPYDEELFTYFATTRLAQISLDGSIREFGPPAIYSSVTIAPDGQHILVTRIEKPFSYLLPVSGFPQTIDVFDLRGSQVYRVAQVPMAENIPIEGVRTEPRSITWKPGEPATLYWMEALDGGDPNQPAEHRDRLMSLAAPFNSQPTEILKIEHRGSGFATMSDASQIVVTDYDRDRRWTRSIKYNLNDLTQAGQVLVDRNIRDRYNDPGSFVTKLDSTGYARIWQQEDSVYRIGSGASPQGDLPFVDRFNLTTMETERLWHCPEDVYEQPTALLFPNDGGPSATPGLITSRESSTEPANLFQYDLSTKRFAKLTEFPDPTPQIRGIKKELVTYQRADGVPLSATLYLPEDYQPGTRLPLIIWAYPREFSDAATAGQVSGNPNRFVRMSGITHLTLVTQGYAVMDSATMPIVGDPETANDTFVEQIVSSAQAAIDYAVEAGVADRNRVGVGGHSYGAFMTANLLAHCDLFHAGLARSGAYNRTLTPFGFQAERRDFWKAKDIYFNLSPFNYAHQIKTPLLLIHGENDNNSGTFPIQSERMYQAVKGNGGDVRLVMLPYESHGYRARESVLHSQAEMIEWFDRFLKTTETTPSVTGTEGSSHTD